MRINLCLYVVVQRADLGVRVLSLNLGCHYQLCALEQVSLSLEILRIIEPKPLWLSE